MWREYSLLIIVALALGPGCDVLPAGTAGAGGGQAPNGVTNTAMTRQQHEALFPINMGAHAAADCNSCHGGFPSFKQFSCTSCHDHAQPATDAAHAGVTGYRYDSQACLGCHPTGTAAGLSRADHTAQFFPIDVGTTHGSAQCSDCHTTADKTQFTCITCHEHAQDVIGPTHATVTGYSYDSKACLGCHPQSNVPDLPRADHKAFPIDVGTTHGSAQCSDCHTTADKTQFTCIACHDHAESLTTPKHTSVAGYTYDSAACYRCHADGRAVFDHATLPVPPNCVGCHQAALAMAVTTPASMHVTNKFPTTCESCHKSFTSWGPGTAMQHQAVGGTTAKCETCHLSTFTGAVSPFNHAAQKVSASTCNVCHTDFTTWTKFVHNPSNCYNGATGRAHQGATCTQCHTVAADYSKSSCTACHSNRGTSCD